MNDKINLNFTPTGKIPTKDITRYVSIRFDDIVDQTRELATLEVNIVPLHNGDENTGVFTYIKQKYFDIIKVIFKHNKELVIGVSNIAETSPGSRKDQSI